jgi:hypothetical protein
MVGAVASEVGCASADVEQNYSDRGAHAPAMAHSTAMPFELFHGAAIHRRAFLMPDRRGLALERERHRAPAGCGRGAALCAEPHTASRWHFPIKDK